MDDIFLPVRFGFLEPCLPMQDCNMIITRLNPPSIWAGELKGLIYGR